MPKRQKPKSGISVNISGDVSGQIVVGSHNKVIKSVTHSESPSAELEELRHLLIDLKNKIQTESSDDKKENALERVNELEQAIFEKKPDRTTIEYVQNWFRKNLPNLAGAVTNIAGEVDKHTL